VQEKSEEINQLEESMKQLRKIERTAEFLREKYYQANLELGYNFK